MLHAKNHVYAMQQYKIVYYDTSVIKFYSDECEVYRPSEARVIIAFVTIKHLCTSDAVCDFTIQRGLSAHLSSSTLARDCVSRNIKKRCYNKLLPNLLIN